VATLAVFVADTPAEPAAMSVAAFVADQHPVASAAAQ
jgi:hypothetical protein